MTYQDAANRLNRFRESKPRNRKGSVIMNRYVQNRELGYHVKELKEIEQSKGDDE